MNHLFMGVKCIWVMSHHSITPSDSSGLLTYASGCVVWQVSQLQSGLNRTRYSSSSLLLRMESPEGRPGSLPYLSNSFIVTTSPHLKDHAHLKWNVIHMFLVPLHLNHQRYIILQKLLDVQMSLEVFLFLFSFFFHESRNLHLDKSNLQKV